MNVPPWEQSRTVWTDRRDEPHYLFLAILRRHLNKDGLSASSTKPTLYLTIVCVHITVNILIFICLLIGVLVLEFYSSVNNRVYYSTAAKVQT
jgi:hypothetical protein